MKILLLSCCAPCCCAVIEKMAREGYDFAVAFYNPNIVPAAEYEKEGKKTGVCAKDGKFRLLNWNMTTNVGAT